LPSLETPSPLTIARLAKAAGVGVERVRHYQSCELLRVPAATGGFRVYPAAVIERIAFIKRAQALGLSLDEVRSLLDLADGRNRRAIQSVTLARLGKIEDKLAGLKSKARGAARIAASLQADRADAGHLSVKASSRV
jgi:MerR family mercuric resistance operon transcriptional regulator